MKKILLAFLLLAVANNSLFAGSVGMGFKGGIDIAGQNVPSGSLLSQTGPILGFTGGLFADIKVFKFLSIQSGVDFTQKGIQGAVENYPAFDSQGNYLGTSTENVTYIYNYFEIPLLLKGNFSMTHDLTANLLAGPALDFLFNATVTGSQLANGSIPAVTQTSDITNHYPGTDWGFILGGGVEYLNFILDVRYEFGLDSVNYSTIAPVVHNGVLSFEAGYRIF